MQSWPEHIISRCEDFGLIVPGWLSCRKIFTTCLWAGMGIMTSAMRYIKRSLQRTYGIEMDLSLYAVTDYEDSCQHLLKTYCPAHRFSDLYDYHPGDLAMAVPKAQIMDCHALDAFRGSSSQKSAKKEELIQEFKATVEKLALETYDWPTQAPCIACGQWCHLRPPTCVPEDELPS